MQIWFLSNGSYSLKKCHNPFGKAIQPPLTAKCRLNTLNPNMALPLCLGDHSILPPTYPNKTQIHPFIDIITNVFTHPIYINSKKFPCPMPARTTGHWYLFTKTPRDRNECLVLCSTCCTRIPLREYIEWAFGVTVLGSNLGSIQTPGVPPWSPLTWS